MLDSLITILSWDLGPALGILLELLVVLPNALLCRIGIVYFHKT